MKKRKPTTITERQLFLLRKDLVLVGNALGRLQARIDDHDERLRDIPYATDKEFNLWSAVGDLKSAVDEIDAETDRVHDLLAAVRKAARR